MRDVLDTILRRFAADTGTIHRLDGDVLVLEAEIGLPPQVAATSDRARARRT